VVVDAAELHDLLAAVAVVHGHRVVEVRRAGRLVGIAALVGEGDVELVQGVHPLREERRQHLGQPRLDGRVALGDAAGLGVVDLGVRGEHLVEQVPRPGVDAAGVADDDALDLEAVTDLLEVHGPTLAQNWNTFYYLDRLDNRKGYRCDSAMPRQ
jgi:hypothetical protein